jgi:hypothetical protein
MTMHLVRGMTSLNNKQRKAKGRTRADRDAQAAHNKWLRERGVHPEQLKAALPHDAKGRRLGVTEMPDYKPRKETLPTSDRIAGNGIKKHENVYTGDEIAGIGLLHKSNLVPVRKDSNDAKEIARMRRG